MLWSNKKMLELCGAANQMALAGKNFSVMSGVPMSEIITAVGKKVITVSGKNFYAYSYLMEAPDRDYWMTTLEDRSELEELEDKLLEAFKDTIQDSDTPAAAKAAAQRYLPRVQECHDIMRNRKMALKAAH